MIVSCKIGLTYGYSFPVSAGGGGQTPVRGTPCSGLYREAPPDRSTFFRDIKGYALYLLKNMKG